MSKVKKFISVLGLMLVIFILGGCGKAINNAKVDEAVKENEKQIYIPIISKGWQHLFWQSVKMGANKAAKDYDVKITFEGPESDSSISKQVEMIDSTLDKKPTVLVLSACDSKAVIPELEKAKDSNVPVIAFDSGIDSDIITATVSTDNLSASGLAADKLAEAIGQEGEVAVLCHDEVSVTGISRRDGFVNRIKEKYPKIKVVDIQYGSGDHVISKNLTKTIIENHPNIKGIFATNEGSAVGLIGGITEENKIGKIAIIGFDAGKYQKDAVRSGVMLGAVSQDPVEMGYKAVETAYKVCKGEKIEKNVYTEYIWYDKTNVDNEELKLLLYD